LSSHHQYSAFESTLNSPIVSYRIRVLRTVADNACGYE